MILLIDIVVGTIIGLLGWSFFVGVPQAKRENERKFNQHIVYEQQIIHLGGHPFFKPNEKIIFQIKTPNPNHEELYINNDFVDLKDIIRCELLTEQQMSKDVTFSRLIALGVFAFAFKKQNTIVETFLALSYKYEGVQVDCIFKGNLPQQLPQLVFQIKKLILNNNKIKEENI